MKVLYYNWTPLDSIPEGGGVAVYMINLFKFLSEHDTIIEPIFLSSGYFYDNSFPTTYIREEQQTYGYASYSIINSPVPAPLSRSYPFIKESKGNGLLLSIICDLIDKVGGIDVIHFESFEGLSMDVLRLKLRYKNIRIVHSIHDYGLICPNVRLWRNTNTNCFPNIFKYSCAKCLSHQKYHLKESEINHLIENRCGLNTCHNEVNIVAHRIKQLISGIRFQYFFSSNIYQKSRIDYINRFSNVELCVSKRVKNIVETVGVDSSKTRLCYIGTDVAENCEYRCRTKPDSHIFTILYMGYSSIEKGFFFFLEAMENYSEQCQNIRLRIASKIDNSLSGRIQALKSKFYDVELINGYSRSDFDRLFFEVNLGIVTPLWEDNLPQVAIEMISNGIPILTSKHGGACELNSNSFFHFNSQDELNRRINTIVQNRDVLDNYWDSSIKLITMDEHVKQLIQYYN